MSFWEVLQVISVVAAAIAAVGSWRVSAITSKQYKLQKNEKIKKYRPLFKIKSYYKEGNKYIFNIVNQGYPAFAVNYINWDGEGVIIKEFFNAELVRSQTRKKVKTEIERYENLTIVIELQDELTTEGFIQISGFDIEHNDFTFKTPLIQIKKSKIINGIKLTYQNII